MKVLVIDDDKMICIALKTIIESEDDMKVVAYGYSYEDAISLFEKHYPDICLFDIQIHSFPTRRSSDLDRKSVV